MKISAVLCTLILIFIAICGGVYAFFGFDALLFLCFYSEVFKRVILALGCVSALFMLYALIFLRPFRALR